MEIEQLPPNRPNFLLICVLFIVTIFIVFGIVVAVLHMEGKSIVPHADRNHVNASLHISEPFLRC